MTSKEVRALAARRAVEVALVRAHPDLTDGALEYLVAAAQKTIEWEDAVASGTTFDVHSCVAACVASDVGQMIFGNSDDTDTIVDHVAATADMTPRDALAYAHKHGLK